MYISNQIKLFIAIFACLGGFTANSCMLSDFKHKPIKYSNDETNNKKRLLILEWLKTNDPTQYKTIQKDITVLRNATTKEQQGKCLAYAVNKITNGTAPLKLYDNNTSNFNVEKFFKQTKNPKKNGLAIYTNSKDDHQIEHFAVIIDEDKNIFESQFGPHTKILHHQPFAVPAEYGNTISFWTLKKEFTTLKGKRKLRKEINKDINKTSGQSLGQSLLLFSFIEPLALGLGLGTVLAASLTT